MSRASEPLDMTHDDVVRWNPAMTAAHLRLTGADDY
jgi:hypothetical protein